MVERLSKEQAAIIGAYTGVISGPFADIQEYAEKKLGRPLWTHQFGNEETAKELEKASEEDFMSICYEET